METVNRMLLYGLQILRQKGRLKEQYQIFLFQLMVERIRELTYSI
jgi:hypothetical protein